MKVLFLAAALSFAAIQCEAQTEAPAPAASSVQLPRYRFRVLGLFDDQSGLPVEGADVIDVRSGNSVRTTSTGTASLLFLPDGGGLVRIRKIGYKLQTLMVSIAPEDTAPLTLILERAVELPAIATIDSAPRYRSSWLRGFEERRKMKASGEFMSEAEIRKDEGRSLATSLMAHLPGVIIITGKLGTMQLARSPRCAKGGPPSIYLDGLRLTTNDLSEFQLENLSGVEYYAINSIAPAEFGQTASSCGSLLLWSRQ
jgi:hypothetical protein